MPDSDTLQSLVLASREYHQAYLAVRPEVLESLVKRQYTGFLDLAEALTAVRSQGVHFSSRREDAIFLLDRWRRRNEIRALSQFSGPLFEPDGVGETIKLLHFHKVLSFFLEDYSLNVPRPPWIPATQWENKHLPLQLTPLEKCRFLRAMCRFQILKNIFGDPVYDVNLEGDNPYGDGMDWQMGETGEPIDPSRRHRPEGIVQQAYRLFHGTMPPWEYEEMGCVFGYLISKIKAITEEISDDLRRLRDNTPCEFFWDILPKEQRPPSSCDIEIESDLVHFYNHFKGLAGLGPEFLYHILHVDRLSRRNIVCVNTRGYWTGPFIGLLMGLAWTERFPFIDPADEYEFQPLGNAELWSNCPPIEQPTLGWKKTWLRPHAGEDLLEDSMDLDRENETDWDWCYALWDEKRLQGWKAPFLEEGWRNEPSHQLHQLREANNIPPGLLGRFRSR